MKNKSYSYSLWRMSGCQQGMLSVVWFILGGHEIAPKPPQAIYNPLWFIKSEHGSQLLSILGYELPGLHSNKS